MSRSYQTDEAEGSDGLGLVEPGQHETRISKKK